MKKKLALIDRSYFWFNDKNHAVVISGIGKVDVLFKDHAKYSMDGNLDQGVLEIFTSSIVKVVDGGVDRSLEALIEIIESGAKEKGVDSVIVSDRPYAEERSVI